MLQITHVLVGDVKAKSEFEFRLMQCYKNMTSKDLREVGAVSLEGIERGSVVIKLKLGSLHLEIFKIFIRDFVQRAWNCARSASKLLYITKDMRLFVQVEAAKLVEDETEREGNKAIFI